MSPLARPARTYLPAGAERWSDASLLEPDDDPAHAAALLDSAGWRTGSSDGIRRDAAGKPLAFTVVAPQPLETVLTIVQSQLRAVGIDAQLRFMEGSAFLAMLRNPVGRPAAIAVSLFPEKFMFPDPSSQLHSQGGVNLTGWGSPATDSIIERLGTILSDGDRAAAYHDLQRRVAEEVPILYTVYFPRTLAMGERLRDVEVDLNGPFAHVTGWWIPAAQRRRGASAAPASAPADSTGSRP
jgi:peptide/nickel transport system substrate-binding protein